MRNSLLYSLLLLLSLTAMGATHNVRLFNNQFIPKHVVIQKGDTVLWNWENGNHNIICEDSPGSADPRCGNSPALKFPPYSYSFTYTNLGLFPYYCDPHVNVNMTGIVHVVKKNFTIKVKNNFFEPKEATIAKGDTVTWVWEGSGHNVVCENISDPNCGSSPNSPTVTYGAGTIYSFTYNTPGTYAFFCNPHRLSANMTGKLTVVDPPSLGKPLRNNGRLEISITGTAGRTNVVQVLDAFEPTPIWTPVHTNVPSGNSFIYTDPNPGARRYYRAVTF